MRKLFALLGLATSAAAALVYGRARGIAEREQRPLTDVLAEMPGRLAGDVSTIGDDLRQAADEGRAAAARRQAQLDEELGQARQGD